MFDANLDRWQTRSLSSLADYENGFAFSELHWSEQGLPIVRIAQITGSQGIVDRYPGRLPDNFRVDDKSLIFSWSGTLAVVRWAGGPAWLNQHLFKVVPVEGVDPSFLFHLLTASVVEMNKRTHGSTMKHIKRSELREFFVFLPTEINEQQALARILDTLDTAIYETEAIIAKLKAVKQGLLHDLLTRGVDANGELRPAQADAPHLYKESPLGWIPKEWTATSLGTVTTWASGGTPSRAVRSYWTGDVPLLTPKDMKSFELDDTSEHITSAAAQGGSRVMPAETIFIVVRGMILAHSFPVVLSGTQMAFNQDVKAITPDPQVNSRFLAHWFVANTDNFLRKVTEATHGTKKLDLDNLVGMPIGIPPLAEQLSVVSRQAAIDRPSASETSYLTQLQALKTGLMDDLLTGRVRVTPLLAPTEQPETEASI